MEQDHNIKSTVRLAIYQIAVTSAGALDKTKLVNGVLQSFYVQLYSDSVIQSAQKASMLLPSIPGFALRHDTGVLSYVDEQEGRVHVLACTGYSATTTASGTCDTANFPTISSYYGSAKYKDLEFVGKVPYSSSVTDPLTTPSKMFFTSVQDLSNARAELYVQCAKCQGGGITNTAVQALAESDCFCPPGYMIVSADPVNQKPQR